MKYEIIKDKEDLYVLVINNIVVLISRDLTAITSEILDDAQNRLTNPRRLYSPAIIHTNAVKIPPKEPKSIFEALGE